MKTKPITFPSAPKTEPINHYRVVYWHEGVDRVYTMSVPGKDIGEAAIAAGKRFEKILGVGPWYYEICKVLVDGKWIRPLPA